MHYCSKECQQNHWRLVHKHECDQVQFAYRSIRYAPQKMGTEHRYMGMISQYDYVRIMHQMWVDGLLPSEVSFDAGGMFSDVLCRQATQQGVPAHNPAVRHLPTFIPAEVVTGWYNREGRRTPYQTDDLDLMRRRFHDANPHEFLEVIISDDDDVVHELARSSTDAAPVLPVQVPKAAAVPAPAAAHIVGGSRHVQVRRRRRLT